MPQKMDTGWFILIGMFGVFLNQTMYTFAVYYAGAALASILQLTNTPTTAGVAILVGLEKFTWYKGAGLFGAVFGALIMVVAGKPTDAAANRTLGIVISLVQAWFIAAWVVIAKKYLYVKYSPTIVASWMHVTGLPWIIMVALSTYGFSGPGGWETFKLDSTGIWAVAFACLFHSVVAYLCVNYANSHLDASICATFGTLNPLFGTVSSVLILGESVSAADIIGGLMILAGLACVVYQRFLDSKKAKAALEPPEAIPAVIPTSEDPSTHNSDLDKMQVELDDISDDSDH
jgi:drug/metabolite transporter (DMT)-like permease